MQLKTWIENFLKDLSHFPWKNTALTLRERFREDRLGLSASSLTFTTTIALVPFITVVLALLTAFPMFAKFQDVMQKWLVDSLIPDNIARQVLGYLSQFAGKANRLGVVGLAALFITALSLVFTIDRTLNGIWRVRRARPWGQRVLIYWAAMTLGPLLLAASLTMTSYLVTQSRDVVNGLSGELRFLLDAIEFSVIAAVMAAMYHYVPNTRVRWGHALVGGLFAAAGIEFAKKILALYFTMVPTYAAVYGAFATVPIMLIWLYVAWVIVLLGAVIVAYLPSLFAGVARRGGTPGWEFTLALEALGHLERSRYLETKGLTALELAMTMHVDPVQLESVIESLVALDWVGRLEDSHGRYVLLINPRLTPLGPLMDRLLLTPAKSTIALSRTGLPTTTMLIDVL